MVHLTEKEFSEFKKICDKEGIKYETEAEYRESANNLLRFVEISYDMAKEEFFRKEQLKNEPNGFALASEGRTCYVCSTSVHGEIWYDKWGLKCMNCQVAFKKKVFPGYILKDRDNNRHVTDSKLNWKYKVHPQTLKKLVRDGKLKPRVIPNGPMIFLKTENPDLPLVIAEAQNKKSSKLP